MNNEDKELFLNTLIADCERRGKPPYSEYTVNEMFEDLEDITVEQFKYAAKCHRRSNAGMYALSVASIRKQLGLKNVQDLEWIDVIAMAKSKNTPLAIVASRYIKPYELKAKDIENRGSAELFLSELPATICRLESGEFTEHEIVLCAKYGINPNHGIHTGHATLPNPDVLQPRLERAKSSHAMRLMIEEKRAEANTTAMLANPKQQIKIAQEIAKISESIPEEKEREIDNTEELKREFDKMMDKAVNNDS